MDNPTKKETTQSDGGTAKYNKTSTNEVTEHMGGTTTTDASNIQTDGADGGGGQERIELRQKPGIIEEESDPDKEQDSAEDGLPAIQIVNDNSVRYETE